METITALMSRRSVRKYKAQQIADDVVSKMIEAARFAPSWANTQCSRFIFVKEQAVKNRIAEAFTQRNPGYNSLLSAPLVVVACAEKGRSGFYKGEASTDKGDWFMFDVALALENMVLAAWDQGVGSVYLGLFDAKRVREAFSLPDNMDVVAVVPFGYPDEEPKCPARKEPSDIVFYEKCTPKSE